MINKKLLTTFLLTFSFSAIAISAFDGTTALVTIGSTSTQTCTLNSTNAPVEEEGKLTLREQYSTFEYTSASLSDGYHVSLDAGGTISKVEASYGLKSIQATFEGALRFECGFESDYQSQEVIYMTELTSGQTYNVEGNYWNITALDTTNITSITLTYDCKFASAPTTPTIEGLVDIQEMVQFADIIKIDDTIYLKVNCTYNNTLGRLSAEDLTIVGDKSHQFYSCSYIETTGVDTFTAYFNISDSHETILGTEEQVIIFCHLRVKDFNYNKTESSAGTGNVSTEGNYLLPRNLSVSGNRTIEFGVRDTKNGAKLAWFILRKGNIVDFNTALSNDTANENNPDNPFAPVNGGSDGGAPYATETDARGSYRYGNVNNKTFKASIISNKNTNATLSFITGGRPNLILSYNQVADSISNAYLSDVTVNGDATNINGLDTKFSFVAYNNMGSWNYYRHIPLFTLPLVEGLNEISFKINNVETSNPLNFAGVSFNLEDADARIALKRAYDVNYSSTSTLPAKQEIDVINYSKDTTYVRYGDYNPIYNVEGSPSFNAFNFGYEAGQAWRNGEIIGYTLTSKIYAEEEATAVIRLIASGATNRSFCPVEANGNSIVNFAYLASSSVNGSSENITYSETVTEMLAWSTYREIDFITVKLQKGLNVIQFRLLGKNIQSKLNLRGLSFETSTNICLG